MPLKYASRKKGFNKKANASLYCNVREMDVFSYYAGDF